MLTAARRAPRRPGGWQAGTSATEFALLLPLLLMIMAGMTECAGAIDNWRKTTLLARTVADLTALGDTQAPIRPGTMSDIVASAARVLQPFDATGVRIVVSALGVDLEQLNLRPRVCSSFANANAGARPTGVATDITVPAGYQITGMRYVLAEVSMDYKPRLGGAVFDLIPGFRRSIALSAVFPWPARGGLNYESNPYAEVVLPGGSACPRTGTRA